MIVVWSSVKGAPGVSGWSVLTAGLLTGVDIAVLEADLSGGVMVSRYGVPVSPGAAELVVAAGRDARLVEVERFGQRVGDRAWMVPGPVVPAEAMAVWRGSIERLARVLAADDRLWLVDVGRFRRELWPWFESAALVVTMSTGWNDALVQLAPVVQELQTVAPVRVVVAGKAAYPMEEIAEFLSAPVSMVPTCDVVDESRVVWGGGLKWRRGATWAAAGELAATLTEFSMLVGGRDG